VACCDCECVCWLPLRQGREGGGGKGGGEGDLVSATSHQRVSKGKKKRGVNTDSGYKTSPTRKRVRLEGCGSLVSSVETLVSHRQARRVGGGKREKGGGR